jgi:hypothetical protein
MNSHDADGIRVGVLVVLPAFRVGILSVEFKEIPERFVFFLGLRVVVNGFEI